MPFYTIWIWLPEQPIEYYNSTNLRKIDSQIGSILKIDSCTRNTSRGKYAVLCILVQLKKPVPKDILIGKHLQKKQHYESTTPLCQSCGCLRHTLCYCTKPGNMDSGTSTASTKNEKEKKE